MSDRDFPANLFMAANQAAKEREEKQDESKEGESTCIEQTNTKQSLQP